MDCCLCRVEKLITCSSLSKEKIPLFAALFISRKLFQNFFAYGLGKIHGNRKTNQYQRRTQRILEWLKQESLESALEKIMNHLPKSRNEIDDLESKEDEEHSSNADDDSVNNMKISPIRNIRLFHKRCGNLIKREWLHRNKLLAESVIERSMKK
uniref:Uncharacterized protein n=1 Tax=Glossina palpalis gambiensis TaxID=67801 RepID=A0A1B0B825_9MUSC